MVKPYSVLRTNEFVVWFERQDETVKDRVRARVSRIEIQGHFGQSRALGGGLYELKWRIGLRVYFAFVADRTIVILLGGNKNGQAKDIKKARSLIDTK